MQAVIDGYLLGFSLILAIGAQNAFVLRQGLRREHVLPLVVLCGASDAVLIAAGVSGFGALARAAPGIAQVMLFGGVAFLLWYGAQNLLAAWRGGEVLEAGEAAGSLWRAVLTCLALTWLNPHVYLDTVVLLGSISAQYDNRLGFGAGAVTASFSFFFMLGYGARLLAPFFRRPSSWRVLDLIVGLTMWAIAAKLLLG
ncbi:LysE/ArgO family amino acid transporter [Roseovarius sp. MMSF_3281]|uniref:LysE/ArgO family amino acid transporter n=1 Tax=Roseovarius sp. MMSF_3281 TaxID=3046694 RepID=UPI00273D1825|nr:LysE/ArgO family amino acid transporter [Roseovarius sp. MMSF_3281]